MVLSFDLERIYINEEFCKHTNNIPLLHFTREYSRYCYLYFYLREGLTKEIYGQLILMMDEQTNQPSTLNRGKSRDRI